jgi:hypothetical protein
MDISHVHDETKTMETGDLTTLPLHPQVSRGPEHEGTYGGARETRTNNKCAADERPLMTARAAISPEVDSTMTKCPDSQKEKSCERRRKGPLVLKGHVAKRDT